MIRVLKDPMLQSRLFRISHRAVQQKFPIKKIICMRFSIHLPYARPPLSSFFNAAVFRTPCTVPLATARGGLRASCLLFGASGSARTCDCLARHYLASKPRLTTPPCRSLLQLALSHHQLASRQLARLNQNCIAPSAASYAAFIRAGSSSAPNKFRIRFLLALQATGLPDQRVRHACSTTRMQLHVLLYSQSASSIPSPPVSVLSTLTPATVAAVRVFRIESKQISHSPGLGI